MTTRTTGRVWADVRGLHGALWAGCGDKTNDANAPRKLKADAVQAKSRT